eukprot:EG_transcript_18516
MKHEVALGGPVLGRLLHAFTVSHDTEGLLLGRTATSTNVQKGDHDEPARISVVEYTEVVAFLPLGSSLTFYNSAGVVQHEALPPHDLAGLQAVGWYRMRRNTAPRLSVREAAVLRHFTSLVPRAVFALFTARSSPEGATLSHQCSFHKVDPQTSLLLPVPCHIVNLTSGSMQEYQQFASWAPTGVTAEKLSTSEALDREMLASAQHQTEAIEKYFASHLQQLEALAAEVHASGVAVAEGERRLQRLRREAAERPQPAEKAAPLKQTAKQQQPGTSGTKAPAPRRGISVADIVALEAQLAAQWAADAAPTAASPPPPPDPAAPSDPTDRPNA